MLTISLSCLVRLFDTARLLNSSIPPPPPPPHFYLIRHVYLIHKSIHLVIFFFYFLGLQNGLNVYYCLRCLQYILTRLKHIHLVTSCIAITSDLVVFTLFWLHFCPYLVLIASPNPHIGSKLRFSALLDIYLKVINHSAKFQSLSDLI